MRDREKERMITEMKQSFAEAMRQKEAVLTVGGWRMERDVGNTTTSFGCGEREVSVVNWIQSDIVLTKQSVHILLCPIHNSFHLLLRSPLPFYTFLVPSMDMTECLWEWMNRVVTLFVR